ncbi:hypothetical protein D3C76_540340 [compost metagenome]|uniref:Membrane-anchored ribosome-binding protein, inhibits growth in stationary phase, ElaB/YqjD/DUF883 family n=1 Tax=Pseudomonas jinjuensis TaxID=198616 RepID=A0A1H0AJ11_9PSED|nr:YqjD family protein [Pseudomonas jinjuensis]SDN32776.1 Membrane-anchored ribosome-binding protein, inhibits growth in stationary phase, ElaB/YqjD/DUF883 family [Pseudomonas jinjuensis]
MPSNAAVNAAKEEFISEFQTLVSDTEKLLQSSADLFGAEAEQLREQIQANLKRARAALDSTQATVKDRGQATVEATEEYVRENPWKAVGIAAGVGFLFGLLLNRR